MIGANVVSAIKGQMAAHPTATKVVIGGTAVAGLAVGLTACGSKAPPTDASTVASNEYHEFDTNKDGSISADEATIPMVRTSSGENVLVSTYLGDGNYFQTGTTYTYQQKYERSIDKIRSAAGGSDAVASWQEIGTFAVENFDKADKNGVKDGLLDGKEQKSFRKAYGETTYDVGHKEVIAETPFFRTWHDPYYQRPSYDSGPDYDYGGSDYDSGPVYQP